MKAAAGGDDDRLAGHGFGAAHRDRHVGAVILVWQAIFRSDGVVCPLTLRC
jgi:hypothetical protein